MSELIANLPNSEITQQIGMHYITGLDETLTKMKEDHEKEMNALKDFHLRQLNQISEEYKEEMNALNSRVEDIQNLCEQRLENERRYNKQMQLIYKAQTRELKKRNKKLFTYTAIIAIMFLVLMAITTFSIANLSTNINSLNNAISIQNENIQSLYEDIIIIQDEIESIVIEPTVDESATNEKTVEEPAVVVNLTDITKPSNLTADQLNSIIDEQLSTIGESYTKFSGMGESLVKMEQETGVNALFCLSVGSLESGHGTSYAAESKNNLFGLIGNSGNLMSFDSVDDCVMYWGELIRDNYMDNGRTTVSSIQSKYCPGSSTWSGNVTYFMNEYSEHVNF